MLAHLEVGNIEPLQISEIDVCRHHVAVIADLLG